MWPPTTAFWTRATCWSRFPLRSSGRSVGPVYSSLWTTPPELPWPWSSGWTPGSTRCFPGNVLRLYAFLDRPQVVTATLVEEGVALIGAESKNADLEDYFLGLIGGVRHA